MTRKTRTPKDKTLYSVTITVQEPDRDPSKMKYQFQNFDVACDFYNEARSMIGQVGSFDGKIIDVEHDGFGTIIFGTAEKAMDYFKSFGNFRS